MINLKMTSIEIVFLILIQLTTLKNIPKLASSSFKTVLSRYRPLFNVADYDYTDTLHDYHSNSNVSDWPEGTYGLPKPISGCPRDVIPWEKGWRYHDTENNFNENGFSKQLHIDGSVTEEGILHKFCMKTNSTGSYIWPKGRYCFYQYDYKCPRETKPGYVFWDDENTNNHNRHAGTMPSGSYTVDSEIRFCCRIDGDTSKPIVLPSKMPFYLFPYLSTTCQNVMGMNSNIEFLKFDNEDTNNSNSQAGEYPYGIDPSKEDIYLYMCYYTPKNSELNSTYVESTSDETPLIQNDNLVNKLNLQLDAKENLSDIFIKNDTTIFNMPNKFIYIPVVIVLVSIIIIIFIVIKTKYFNKPSTTPMRQENSTRDLPKMNVPKNALNTLEFPEFDNEIGFDDEMPLVYDHTLDGWRNSGGAAAAAWSHYPH